jgi:hypothetical protein
MMRINVVKSEKSERGKVKGEKLKVKKVKSETSNVKLSCM